MKLRVQTHSKSQIFRNLYHGVTPNLIATPIAWSFNLFAYHCGLNIYNTITTINNSPTSNVSNFNNNTKSFKWTGINVTFAGIVAGFAWSICVCPFELIKCYSQRFHIRSNKSIIILPQLFNITK